MQWTVVLYGLVPLIAFVVADLLGGIKWAVAAAVVFALADIFLTYLMVGQVDPASVVAFVLIVVLGAVTLRLKNPLYVKLQPVVMAGLFAVIIAYLQFAAGGAVQRYLPLLERTMPESMRTTLADPAFVAMLDRSVTGMILVLLVHGTWIAWAATRQSNLAWLIVRGVGFWVVFLVYMVLFFGLTLLTGPPSAA